MAEKSVSQVVHADVSFSTQAGEAVYSPVKLVMEMDDRKDDAQLSDGVVRIRLYPGHGPGAAPVLGFVSDNGGSLGAAGSEYWHTFVSTEGVFYFTNEVREREESGYVMATGNTEIDLPYPVAHSFVLEQDGRMFSPRGDVISPNIWFDAAQNKIRLGRPAYGKIKCSYTTSYRILRYYPNVNYQSEVFYDVDAGDYGEILAFPWAQPDTGAGIFTFQVQPPPGVQGEFELYRVVSTGVITPEGSWERPEGWPQAGTFPGKKEDADKLDVAGSFLEVERVHEIAYLRLGDDRAENFGVSSRADVSLHALQNKMDQTSAVYDYTTALGGQVSKIMQDYLKRATDHKLKASIRSVRYDIPWGKPYVEDLPEWQYVVLTTQANGMIIRQGTTLKYKRVVTLKAAKAPVMALGQTDRAQLNSVMYDHQANRLNAYLRRVYERVDWELIRKTVREQYDPELYIVAIDPSVPQK